MRLNKLTKFALTGGLGAVTNLTLFFIFADILRLNPNSVNICCFVVACTQNYVINHLWTFREEDEEARLSFPLWGKFMAASLLGLAANLLVLNILLHIYEWKYLVIPQGVGISAGMALNYTTSKLIVFRRDTKMNKVKNIFQNVDVIVIAATSLLMLAMVLPYILWGQDSVITIHDNLDWNIATLKYTRDNGLFFPFNKASEIWGNMDSIYISNTFTLISLIFYIFPTFPAYVIAYLLSLGIGFFSMLALLRIIFNRDDDRQKNNILFVVAAIYSILPIIPYWRIAVASLPLSAVLFYKQWRRPSTQNLLFCFLYAFITDFGSVALFICGFYLLGAIVVSMYQRKIRWNLLGGLLALSCGIVVANLKMFYLRIFMHEPLNRDFFIIAPADFLSSFKVYLTYGHYHVFSAHRWILIFTFVVFCIRLTFEIKSFLRTGGKSVKSFVANLSNEMKIIVVSIFLAVCFSMVAALSDAKKLEFVGRILPPLNGFSFTRVYIFNQILWYVAFASALVIFRKLLKDRIRMLAVYFILSLQVLYVCTCATPYNDSATTWLCKLKSLNEDGIITYREFFSEELFETIKTDIDYKNEPVIAVGYHPSVLLYSGFNTIDGYISLYPYSDMLRFRKLIQPELEQNEKARNYYDSWGGRRYAYNSQLSYEPTRRSATDAITLHIDEECFRDDFSGKYILSRTELSNAKELGLMHKGTFDSPESIYVIWVYAVE